MDFVCVFVLFNFENRCFVFLLAFVCFFFSFTQLGAWCNALRCNFVDCTRRSYSYEYRLYKYADEKRFRIVFPGLDATTELPCTLNNSMQLTTGGFPDKNGRRYVDVTLLAGCGYADYDSIDYESYVDVCNYRYAVKNELGYVATRLEGPRVQDIVLNPPDIKIDNVKNVANRYKQVRKGETGFLSSCCLENLLFVFRVC